MLTYPGTAVWCFCFSEKQMWVSRGSNAWFEHYWQWLASVLKWFFSVVVHVGCIWWRTPKSGVWFFCFVVKPVPWVFLKRLWWFCQFQFQCRLCPVAVFWRAPVVHGEVGGQNWCGCTERFDPEWNLWKLSQGDRRIRGDTEKYQFFWYEFLCPEFYSDVIWWRHWCC